MTILAFSGSPRPASAVGHLLRAAAATAPAGVAFSFFESTLGLPLFSPDLDGPDAMAPPAVAALRRQVQAADAVLLATPEYAYGMPGSLKNAFDWLVSAGSFYGKPTGVLSAAPSAQGGERARAGLLLTLEALGAAVVPAASFCRAAGAGPARRHRRGNRPGPDRAAAGSRGGAGGSRIRRARHLM